MTDKTEVADTLENDWKAYITRVYAVAEQAFHQYVEPFCKRTHCWFLAGNGTWWLGFEENDQTYMYMPPDDDSYVADLTHAFGYQTVERITENPELERIMKVLRLEVSGLLSNDLGSLMPSRPKSEISP